MNEQNEASDAALEGMRQVGEDVSEAESIIQQRRSELQSLTSRIQSLQSRLKGQG